MQDSRIATLMANHERYMETFAEYCKRIKWPNIMENWIDTFFEDRVIMKMNVKKTEELKIMAVGSGAGQVETCALKQLVKEWSKIDFDVIEPNSGHLSQFKDLAAKENIPGVTFNWNQKTLKEFRQGNHSTKYHFIIASHSLYYMDNVEEVVRYLTSILADGGCLFILMTSEKGCTWKIGERFPQLQNEGQHAICSKHVKKILTANQQQFEIYENNFSIDSTGCFDENSNKGELLIDFITHVAYLKKQASESLYNEIIDFIKSDQISCKNNGRENFKDCDDIICVTK